MAKLFYVGIKALIENEAGEILLLLADVNNHRKNTEPYWDIPGGRIEDAVSTLKREIIEETNCRTEGEPKFVTAVISNHEIPLDDGTFAGLVLMVYTASLEEGSKIKISEEHTDYRWFSRNEAAELLEHKYPVEFTNTIKK